MSDVCALCGKKLSPFARNSLSCGGQQENFCSKCYDRVFDLPPLGRARLVLSEGHPSYPDELRQALEQQQLSTEAHRQHMAKIHAALKAAEQDVANGKVTKEFIDTFIDKIIVTPQSDGTMELDIRIFTGESTTKYLERLKSRADTGVRAGHTFKKMIESYEQSMQ